MSRTLTGLSVEGLDNEDICLQELRQLNSQRPSTEAQSEPVPDHILPGLARYVVSGIVPGSFMYAMLTNDLRGAVSAADSENIRKIPAIYGFFYQYIPSAAWGREDKVRRWASERNKS